MEVGNNLLWRNTKNVVLPGKEGWCAGQCQDPRTTGCPGLPSRRTTASSSPCNAHTAEARERDGQPHGRDTCTECEGKQEVFWWGGGDRERRGGTKTEWEKVREWKCAIQRALQRVREGKWVVAKEREEKREWERHLETEVVVEFGGQSRRVGMLLHN